MTLPAGNDDTIELVLTPEQLLDLSQAAEAAESAAPGPVCAIAATAPVVAPIPAVSMVPVVQHITPTRPLRWHQTPIAKMGANTLAFVAFAWWSVSQLAGQPEPHPKAPVVAAARPLAVVSHPAVATLLQRPAVQVVNPFDKTEVFEFPAGTSEEESREKVAQILLQRARERQSHWVHIKPEAALRTASLATLRSRLVQGPEILR